MMIYFASEKKERQQKATVARHSARRRHMGALITPLVLAGSLLLSGGALAYGGLQGFGDNVPLSFAVKQIVPPNYDVFFGEGVETDLKVSWSGGTAWPLVLERTLEAQDLVAEVVDDKVVVSRRARGNISYTQSRGYPQNTEVLRSPGLVVRPYTTVSDVPDYTAPQRDLGHLQQSAPFSAPEPDWGLEQTEPAQALPAEFEPIAEPHTARTEAPPQSVQPQVSQHPVPPVSNVDPFSPVDRPVPGYVANHQPVQPPAQPYQQAPALEGPVGVMSHQSAVAPPTRVSSPEPDNLAAAVAAEREWVVASGLTLQEVLSDWTEEAGWSLVWDSSYEYPIQADAVFYGPFVSHDGRGNSLHGAAVDLVKSMSNARPRVNADFYLQNRVVVVTTSLEDHD